MSKVYTIVVTALVAASLAFTASAEPFEPKCESLEKHQVPEWFRDAKFGVWAHWGVQCVAGSGDWMARKMYVEGDKCWKFHREKYGHQSEFGYKDLIPLFKAEKWDPDKLVAYYKSLGAQYFFCLGNHHDNFDLWDSKYQPWNSVNMGPKRDIVGEWVKAARKHGLKFGVSIHSDHAWTWFEPSRHYDRTGPKEGVPYDGNLTLADGKGKWWEGYDPQDLYAQNHPESRRGWVENYGWIGWSWGDGMCPPSKEFCENYRLRVFDMVDKYRPDIVYYDAVVLPFNGKSDVGLETTAHIYNVKENDGGAVVTAKMLGGNQRKALTLDVERGTPGKILDFPWQTCTCLGDWHYNTEFYEKNKYKSAAFVVRMLSDVVSKNGNLLLSVPLRADGTFDEKEKAILDEFGEWSKANMEAIVGTRPWKRFGEGPAADKASGKEGGDFNEHSFKDAQPEEIRFTRKGDAVYAIFWGWPENSLKSKVESVKSGEMKVNSVELLGYGKVQFEQTADGLVVALPDKVNPIGPVLKIQ